MATWKQTPAHGRDYQIETLDGLSLEDSVDFRDGTSIAVLGDKTFDELADQAWTNKAAEQT